MNTRHTLILASLLSAVLSACGGGGSSSSTATGGGGSSGGSGPALGPPSSTLVRVSKASPYADGCGGGSGAFEDAEVEPYMAINPGNPSNLIGAWQQDRFSDGGAHGLVVASSMDGGKHWSEHTLRFSVCGGGHGHGGGYERASDPWVSISPDGSAYVISISFSGDTLQPGSEGAVLVSRSADGGVTWSDPQTLIHDGPSAFNDKEAITADPNDSHFVYAVWDRLTNTNRGAAMFARSIDGGASWETAKAIYDPGVGNQTLGNEIVGLADGTILDLFEEIDNTSGNTSSSSRIRVIRSADQGANWSAPITVADNLAVGAADPNTGIAIRSGAGLPQMAAGPGGQLAVVWEDGRFSGGARDGIAYSGSNDGGLHWSNPVRINSATSTPAFTPGVAILADGTVGVSYFDFRHAGSSTTELATDYWFTSSKDGVHWSEQHISGPFDLDLAPDAEGLFIGDYQALGKIGNAFVPFFVQTNDAGDANRNDAYYLPPQPKPLTVTREVTRVALEEQAREPDPAFRGRVHENLMRVLRDEDPVWDQIRAARQAQAQPP
jgi:hypothetical protein